MDISYLHYYIAQDVLKWENKEFPYSEDNPNPVHYWVDEQGEKQVKTHEWFPQEHYEDTFHLISLINKMGYQVQLTQTKEDGVSGWRCTFFGNNSRYRGFHENEKVAVCLATLTIAHGEEMALKTIDNNIGTE